MAGSTQLTGVALYFGPLNEDQGMGGFPGDPGYTGRYVMISEFPRANALTQELGAGYFPGEGLAVLDAPQVASNTRHTATLRVHGRYVIVQATTDADALAAARAVNR